MTAGPRVDPRSIPPLDLMLQLMEEHAPADMDLWREFAAVLDAEGVMDGLSNHDARHLVAAMMMDLNEDDAAGALRKRAGWILAGGSGAAPLQKPGKVAAALRQVAVILGMPSGGEEWLDGPEGTTSQP